MIGTLLGSRDGARRAWPCTANGSSNLAPATSAACSLRAQELGELATDTDVDLAVQMLVGSVLARRVSGISSPPDWARRAVDMISRRDHPSVLTDQGW